MKPHLMRSFMLTLLLPTACVGMPLPPPNHEEAQRPAPVTAGPPPGGNPVGTVPATLVTSPYPLGPAATGDLATDSVNLINYRRRLMGFEPLVRNANLDKAAKSHSAYMGANRVLTHVQDPSKPAFTGTNVFSRLQVAGYTFPGPRYAFDEVFAKSDSPGFGVADDWFASFESRSRLAEPMQKEVGGGVDVNAAGETYLTVEVAARDLDGGLASGSVGVFPTPGQLGVPLHAQNDLPWLSAGETPPIGYPITVHANLIGTLTVQRFVVAPRGGAALPVSLAQHSTTSEVPASVAGIVPLQALSAATTYDVQFTGTLDGIGVERSWSFTTR